MAHTVGIYPIFCKMKWFRSIPSELPLVKSADTNPLSKISPIWGQPMMEEGWRTASESIALELRMPFRMGKAFLLILALEGTNSNRGTYLELGANLTIITFLFTFFFVNHYLQHWYVYIHNNSNTTT